MELIDFGVFTWSLLLGAVAGVVDAFGRAGRIKAYGGGTTVTAFLMAFILAGALAMLAETARGALVLGLSGLGAATLTRLLATAIIRPHHSA